MFECDMETYNQIITVIFDFESSYNRKILNRNGKEWDGEFIPSFTVDELFQMRDYLYCHPIDIRYDFNDCNDVSDLIYDYIRWWVYDLLSEGEISRAKTVLNEGYI